MGKDQKWKELLAKRAELDAQIEAARKDALADAISQARALIAEFGLTAADLFGARGKIKARGAALPGVAKYRDPASGRTWTGRGRPPKWMEGKDPTQFKI